MPVFPSTSLPIADTTAVVKGSADATKLLRFALGGFTTGTTRVLTPPNADGTIAVLGTAQAFTAQQVFETGAAGATPLIVRQTGGVAGTDEVQIRHDGTRTLVASMDGSFRIQHPAASLVEITRSDAPTLPIVLLSGQSGSAGGIYAGYNSSVGVTSGAPSASNAACVAAITGNTLYLVSAGAVKWYNNTVTTGTLDAGLSRAAAKVIGINDGSTGAAGFSSPANTPAQITADTDNYSPGAGINQRWSSDAARNVTGMVAGVAGEMRYVWNIGSNTITLKDESTSTASTAANRFLTSTAADLALATKRCALAMYDSVSARWRVSLLP